MQSGLETTESLGDGYRIREGHQAVVDKPYSLDQIVDACQYVETGQRSIRRAATPFPTPHSQIS